MADQYGIYSLGGGTLVAVVQSDLVAVDRTRAVIPLVPKADVGETIRGLNPVVSLGDEVFVLLTQSIAAVPLAQLKSKVGDLGHLRDEITRALDILFHGV